MKKKRRIPLAITILVPVVLGVLAVQGAAMGATYHYSRQADYNDAVEVDKARLFKTVWSMPVSTAEACDEIRKVYQANPLPAWPTTQEQVAAYRALFYDAYETPAYQEFINNFPAEVLGDYADYISVGFFDSANARFVTVHCHASPSMLNPSFPGSFDTMDVPEMHLGMTFYGFSWHDEKRGADYLISGSCSPIKKPEEGYWVIRYTSMRTVYSESQEFMSRFAWIAVVSVVTMAILSFLAIQLLLLNPIRRLSKTSDGYVMAMNEGTLLDDQFHLDKKKHRNEITTLNDSLFYMQGAMKDYSVALREGAIREERAAADLALAERIQASMVPNAPLIAKDYSFYGEMHPAKEVGGDFFSYFRIDDNRAGFYIADVSGKGVPAALFMARAASVSRLLIGDLDIEKIGEALAKDNREELFVTGFFAVIDTKKKELHYVNCGHEPVFFRHDGVYTPLDEEPNLPLGCLEDFDYVKQKIALCEGDALFLYTDGLSEAMNGNGDIYGKEAIVDVLNRNATFSGEELFNLVDQDVAKFVDGAEQSDDTCLLYFEFGHQARFDFSPDLDGLAKLIDFVENTLSPYFGPETLGPLGVALDEVASNVIRYSKATCASVHLSFDAKEIRVTLSDDGIPFDPTTAEVHKEEGEPGGLGILLASTLTSSLCYRHAGGKNLLSFVIDKKPQA